MTLSFGIIVHFLLQVATALRALIRRDREPASRAAWLLLIMALPFAGIVIYFLFGETSIGGRAGRRMDEAARRLRTRSGAPDRTDATAELPVQFRQLFRRASAVNGFLPVGGNSAVLAADENEAIARLVADIDSAESTVHLLFYIWLEDRNGGRVLDAVERAAARGVTCRVLIDGLGSRALARSARWADLAGRGVRTAITFQMKWLPVHIFFSRIDLRNHRKIAVIDGRVAWSGSQNCADREFRVKPKYAPWIDVMLRVEGPVVRQLQEIFAIDWMTHDGEDVSELLDDPVDVASDGFVAVAAGTGPNIDAHAVSDLFAMMLNAAEREVIITTPYFVPDDTLIRAITGAALRGVAVTMILPARNDSVFVARASRSYYSELLHAGVRLAEFGGGLLHAKTMTVDGACAFVGSANMDRRSFELNYESNLYFVSEEVTGALRERQLSYLENSRRLALGDIRHWRWMPRAVNNLFATMGPLL